VGSDIWRPPTFVGNPGSSSPTAIAAPRFHASVNRTVPKRAIIGGRFSREETCHAPADDLLFRGRVGREYASDGRIGANAGADEIDGAGKDVAAGSSQAHARLRSARHAAEDQDGGSRGFRGAMHGGDGTAALKRASASATANRGPHALFVVTGPATSAVTSSWPGLSPQVGYTRLAALNCAELGPARVPMPSRLGW